MFMNGLFGSRKAKPHNAQEKPVDAPVSDLVGTVKWFDPAKGYGFVTNASGDLIFLHATALSAAGYTGAKDGDTIYCQVMHKAKAPAVNKVYNIAPKA